MYGCKIGAVYCSHSIRYYSIFFHNRNIFHNFAPHKNSIIQDNMVRQCFILFGCLALGELIVRVLDIKLPASIVGMLILTLLLKLKVIKLEWVRGLTDFLIANLGFFFVPPGVADLIKAEIVPITLATLLSTIIVLLITGQTHQVVNKGEDKVRKKIQTKKNKNIQL